MENGDGPNVLAFRQANMLSQDAAGALTSQQRAAIESWSSETVQQLISLYEQTGQITAGISWI